MIFADLPRLKGKDFVQFGNSANLFIYPFEPKNQPIDRASFKKKLFMQYVKKIFRLVATDGHDCKIIIDMLLEKVIFRLILELLLRAIIVVHQQ